MIQKHDNANDNDNAVDNNNEHGMDVNTDEHNHDAYDKKRNTISDEFWAVPVTHQPKQLTPPNYQWVTY